MEPGDLIDLSGFQSFTCFWHGGEFRAGPGWVITIFTDRQASEGAVLVALDQDHVPVASAKRAYLKIPAASQVLRQCRAAGLHRSGYSVGPDLELVRPDIRHPEALSTASKALAEAWPRQGEGLPVSPVEMLRSIRQLAHAIDDLLTEAESRAAGSGNVPPPDKEG